MQNSIQFVLHGSIHTVEFNTSGEFAPTTTVLNYLRSLPDRKGTKEGCAEGDCGACTVVLGIPHASGSIRYLPVNSCLMFLPSLHGKQLITVEDLALSDGSLHPVQQALVKHYGSQCGFCTPGIVMSMFGLFHGPRPVDRAETELALAGNLCRCTGYRSIVDASLEACSSPGRDHFTAAEAATLDLLRSIPGDPVLLHHPDGDYLLPSTTGQALAFLAEHPGVLITAGSTDNALRVTKNHEKLGTILDLSAVQELKSIRTTSRSLTIGSGASITDVAAATASEFPALGRMLDLFGSRQIRNLATIGGNLGTASPISDSLPLLIAYGAVIHLESRSGKRTIAMDDYLTGYRKTVRRPDELIVAVELPKPPAGAVVRSYKISRRKDVDISTVSAAFNLLRDDSGRVTSIVLAYGGVAERTMRAAATERALTGREWTRDTIEDILPILEQEFTPLTDVRGSELFRRTALRNLLMKFWIETMETEVVAK